MIVRHLLPVLLLTVLAALTFGCAAVLPGSGPRPLDDPAASASPSVPWPPQTPVPVRPSQWAPHPTSSPLQSSSTTASSSHDAQGATAAVTHYGDLLQTLTKTGDTAPFAALTTATCLNCERLQTMLAGYQAEGGQAEGGALHPRSTRPVPAASTHSQAPGEIEVLTDHEAASIVITTGNRTRFIQLDAAVYVFRLAWDGAGWKVTSLYRE